MILHKQMEMVVYKNLPPGNENRYLTESGFSYTVQQRMYTAT